MFGMDKLRPKGLPDGVHGYAERRSLFHSKKASYKKKNFKNLKFFFVFVKILHFIISFQ